MARNINPDPNNKGENWPQFLKDVAGPEVVAILNDNPAMRLNRKGARALGYSNSQEAVDEAIKREEAALSAREQVARGRALKMGEWWRDTFEVLLPKWAYNQVLKGNRKILLLFGYQFGQDDGNDMVEDATKPLGHKLVPYSRAWITRKRFILFGKPVLQTIKKMVKDEKGEEKEVEVDTWMKFIWEAK